MLNGAQSSSTGSFLLLGRLAANFRTAAAADLIAHLLRQRCGSPLASDRVVESTLRVIVRTLDGPNLANRARRLTQDDVTGRVLQFL